MDADFEKETKQVHEELLNETVEETGQSYQTVASVVYFVLNRTSDYIHSNEDVEIKLDHIGKLRKKNGRII